MPVLVLAAVVIGGVRLAHLPVLASLPWDGLVPPDTKHVITQPTHTAPDVSRSVPHDPLANRGVRHVNDSPAAVTQLPGQFPATGSGSFGYATTRGPVVGTAGKLRRFHVGVEKGVPEHLAAVAATVDQTLGDPRSWTASGRLRLQRVPAAESADFTIYLATPGTARKLCARGKVDIVVKGEPYTSCRAPGKVILNLARWRLSVPEYVSAGVPLEAYRQYMINHEVGHELGHGHELCPAKGRPAPVMQQQTLGLYGCVANAWPYLNGKRYAGPSGAYDTTA